MHELVRKICSVPLSSPYRLIVELALEIAESVCMDLADYLVYGIFTLLIVFILKPKEKKKNRQEAVHIFLIKIRHISISRTATRDMEGPSRGEVHKHSNGTE